MNKIYIYRPHDEYADATGVAFAEDGEQLYWHISSSTSWFRRDMGLTGTWKHDAYKAKYPDGYELVEVIGKDALMKFVDSGDLVNPFRGKEVHLA